MNRDIDDVPGKRALVDRLTKGSGERLPSLSAVFPLMVARGRILIERLA